MLALPPYLKTITGDLAGAAGAQRLRGLPDHPQGGLDRALCETVLLRLRAGRPDERRRVQQAQPEGTPSRRRRRSARQNPGPRRGGVAPSEGYQGVAPRGEHQPRPAARRSELIMCIPSASLVGSHGMQRRMNYLSLAPSDRGFACQLHA
jgi:hypothetical protein